MSEGESRCFHRYVFGCRICDCWKPESLKGELTPGGTGAVEGEADEKLQSGFLLTVFQVYAKTGLTTCNVFTE